MTSFSIIPGNEPPPDSVAAHEPLAGRLPRANPHEVRQILRDAPGHWAPFAPVTDRRAWEAVAAGIAPDTVTALVKAGLAAADEPISPLTASLWRTYMRTGERKSYETPWYERRTALADMLVSYCLQPADHLLDALVDMLWATCEESSWSFPASLPPDYAEELPDTEKPSVDLFSALTGVGLAECLHILRPVLPGVLAQRIEREVTARVVTPYLEDDTWGWLWNRPGRYVNNWTAVCGFGAVGAACYVVRDEARLASILCKAARSMEEYLQTFDPDGGTSEGAGYWNFGFGSFCKLADLVERRTGGVWSWFDAPIVERVARFPLNSRITRDSWPTFSDSDPGARFPGWLLVPLGERFDVPELAALARTPVGGWKWKGANSSVTTALRSVLAGVGTGTEPIPAPAASSWFRGMEWLLSRADPADAGTLSVAVKGGHNAELHNQNDVGSLVVRLGGEDLVVDPGRGLYTRDYFNEHRYEHFVNRSFGHSVPLPAGVEQAEGVEYRAAVVDLVREAGQDRVSFDLTGAYPKTAGLTDLTRTVSLHRGASPRVELTDEFAFAAPGVAESAFVTFAEVQPEEGRLVIRGEHAALEVSLPDGVSVEVHEEVVPLAHGDRRASRVAVRTPAEVEHVRMAFVMTPL